MRHGRRGGDSIRCHQHYRLEPMDHECGTHPVTAAALGPQPQNDPCQRSHCCCSSVPNKTPCLAAIDSARALYVTNGVLTRSDSNNTSNDRDGKTDVRFDDRVLTHVSGIKEFGRAPRPDSSSRLFQNRINPNPNYSKSPYHQTMSHNTGVSCPTEPIYIHRFQPQKSIGFVQTTENKHESSKWCWW